MRRIDTDQDIAEGLEALVRLDPRLIDVVSKAGQVPLRRVQPGFPALVSIIVSQQVSRASAEAILGRLVRLVDPLSAAGVLEAGERVFREAGVSRPKQRTLLALSRAVIDDGLDLHHLAQTDSTKALERLFDVPGVGPWTAQVYLLTAAGHPDIFPAGDVALQGAVADALRFDNRPSAKALSAMAESWAPWRSVAARLFWAYWRELRGREVTPALVSPKRPVNTA